MDDVRGGFVLKARSDEPPARRRSLSERSSNFKDSILKASKRRAWVTLMTGILILLHC